jgi:hypothetical protein
MKIICMNSSRSFLVVAALLAVACGDSSSGTSDGDSGTSSGTTGAASSSGDEVTSASTSAGSTSATTGSATTGSATTGSTGEGATDTDTESGTDTDTGTSTGADALEIEGLYSEPFAEHDITSALWTIAYEGADPSLFSIVWYDNELDTLIAQNDAMNDFNPNLWSKFQWTYAGDALWFCQIVFDAASQLDAESGPDADPSDPGAGGCGMFPWSELTPA